MLCVFRFSSINSTSSFSCSPMNEAWEEFAYDNVCGYMQKGAFFMWGSAIIASFFIFLTILIGLVAMHILEGKQ